jgi:hypothetical protein
MKMTELDQHPVNLRRLHLAAIVVGVLCAVISIVGIFVNSAQFMNSYLFAYQFILGISLGSLALVMLHHMTGGDWGYCIRRVAEASAMMMPLLTILFLPIFFSTHLLYPWARPENFEHDKVMQLQIDRWFNPGFWRVRAVIYFAIWNIWAFMMWYGSGKHDRTGDPWLVVRMQRFSAFGILLFILTVTGASVDWIMAREAHWYSTIIGLVISVAMTLSGLVCALAVVRAKRHDPELGAYLTPPRLNDLGNLMLALVILWAYLSFSQLLIIWMGNMTPDSPWYIRRGFSGDPNAPHGWKGIGALLLLCHFFIPFFVLLGRANKRNLGTLTTLAIMMLLMRLIDCFWWSWPTSLYDKAGDTVLRVPAVHWLTFTLPPALFGIWLGAMLTLLRTRPLLARVEHSPFEHEHGHGEHGHDAHATA